MAWLKSISELRTIGDSGDIARAYLWDIQFPTSPLGDWFPASTVDEPIAIVSSYDFEFHILQFSVPKSLQKNTLNITFYDTIDLKLVDWLKEWVEEMFPKKKGVTPLESIIKVCRIARLGIKREVSQFKTYQVYPDESMINNWTSNSEHKLLTVSFVVAGESV